jgi:hypothetical protein
MLITMETLKEQWSFPSIVELRNLPKGKTPVICCYSLVMRDANGLPAESFITDLVEARHKMKEEHIFLKDEYKRHFPKVEKFGLWKAYYFYNNPCLAGSDTVFSRNQFGKIMAVLGYPVESLERPPPQYSYVDIMQQEVQSTNELLSIYPLEKQRLLASLYTILGEFLGLKERDTLSPVFKGDLIPCD